MTNEELETRLEREPVRVECPLCRHGQWLDATPSRCDQCGSEIEVFAERDAARSALASLQDEGRVAYRLEIPGTELWAVIANRSFRRDDG
ncbi:MAG: hypothetical protein R3326_01890 [Gemmatimonadota bacterium]|nr:hypothetical protein [Gemmatimonadota bacterium]